MTTSRSVSSVCLNVLSLGYMSESRADKKWAQLVKQLPSHQSCSLDMGIGREMRDASIKPAGVGDTDSICQAL